MRPLTGWFHVRRVSGLLPPFGVTKHLDGSTGVTCLAGIPVGRFRIVGNRFVYRFWPIVDELEADDQGGIVGRGPLFGVRPFCRFKLVPVTAPLARRMNVALDGRPHDARR